MSSLGELNSQQKAVADLIHELYNSMARENNPRTSDVRDSLMHAYQHIGTRDPVAMANKLANYLHFEGFNAKIPFTQPQVDLITQISQIGQYAGLNGSFRAWYGDKGQF